MERSQDGAWYAASRTCFPAQDGCGGFCGGSGMAGKCPYDQTCVWNTNEQDDPGDAYRNGICCQPDCADRQCGGDGCGGSCGTCTSTQVNMGQRKALQMQHAWSRRGIA